MAAAARRYFACEIRRPVCHRLSEVIPLANSQDVTHVVCEECNHFRDVRELYNLEDVVDERHPGTGQTRDAT